MTNVDLADWDNNCDCCGQTPIIRDMEMCATCVFGEAAAQQELIEGKLVELREDWEMNGYSLKELQNAMDKMQARTKVSNVNRVSKEMIADAYIEWVRADREYQKAREELYNDDFAHIDTQYEVDYEQEFRTPNKPYRTREDKVEKLYRASTYHNKVYDTLIKMTDLYLAKIKG